MKTIITSILLAAGLTAAAQDQQSNIKDKSADSHSQRSQRSLTISIPGKMHLGLVYPLSTNGNHAALDTNSFSLHLIAGVSAAERGPSFAGISNVVVNDTKGSQFAGFSNHIGKTANGALFAGFMNTYGGGSGSAFAGFTNVASGNINGAQFSGFANVAKNVNGVQFAGFSNTAKNLKGSQFAGFANVAKDVSISQMAGFINTAKDVKGSQFAGFINIAKKVKGAQVAGFINIADSSDCPIGIINIIKHGEKSIGLTIDENQTTMLSFRSGGKVLYGILGVGYNFKNTDEVYAFEAGLGAHFFQSRSFRVNAEITSSMLESFKEGDYMKATLRAMPALKITPFLEIFAGPSLNFISTNTTEGIALTKKTIKEWPGDWDDDFRALYLGYTGGLHILF